MMSSPPATDSLSTAEVDAVLRGLTSADWVRAERLANFRAAGLPDWSGDDLLSEACAKLLSGERVWRRGVPALETIKNVMHSIASNDRRKVADAPIDRFATVDTGTGEAEDDEPPGVFARDERTPERTVDARSQLAALEQLVKCDEDAEMVLMAWLEGLRGKEAAADLGFDMNRYDAARKRLERKIEPIARLRNTK